MPDKDLVDKLLEIHSEFSESEDKETEPIIIGEIKGHLYKDKNYLNKIDVHAMFNLTNHQHGVVFNEGVKQALQALVDTYDGDLNLFVTNEKEFHYEAYIKRYEKPLAVVTPKFFGVKSMGHGMLPGLARALVEFYQKHNDPKFEDKW